MTTSEPCPFTILIDSAESQPWDFHGLQCDANKDYRPLIVTTKWRCLGRYPNSLGDYAIEGCEGECHIERKSIEDCRGTILGWPKKLNYVEKIAGTGRRERFEKELDNLTKIPYAAVIVEGTMGNVVLNVEDYGTKTRETLAKILSRSIMAYQQDYRVPWFFCDGRRHAEVAAFRFFERFWRKKDG